jgi:hypothetical protein
MRERQWSIDGAIQDPDYPPSRTRTGHEAQVRTSRKISDEGIILA